MANEYCKIMIRNLTYEDMVLDKQNLPWGKFVNAPVGKIKPGQNVLAFLAKGRDASPSGTEGHVSYKIGEDGELKIGWNCEWNLIHDPNGKYSIQTTPEESYVTAITGGGAGCGYVDLCLIVIKI